MLADEFLSFKHIGHLLEHRLILPYVDHGHARTTTRPNEFVRVHVARLFVSHARHDQRGWSFSIHNLLLVWHFCDF